MNALINIFLLLLLLATWEGFANCCQRLKICNPCNRWCPRVSGILWRQTSTGIVPIIHCSSSNLVFCKGKVLRKPELPLCRDIVVKEVLTSYLFHTLHPASYCACCGFPWKGKLMSPGRAGTSTTAESSCSGCKAGSGGSSASSFWQPDSGGAEFGRLGVQRHPTGGEERTLGKEYPPTLSPPCSLELQGCCGRDLVQARLACRLPLKWGWP